MVPLPAFFRSGRLRVTVTTPESRSTMMVSQLTGTPYCGDRGRLKGVLDDVDHQRARAVAHDGDHVESDRRRRRAVGSLVRQPACRQTSEAPLLGQGHGFFGRSEQRRGPGLDLTYHDGPSAGLDG